MNRAAAAVLLVLALALCAVPAQARQVEREPIDSLAPDAKKVAAQAVRIHKPLPESLGAPRACDWVESLRWRLRSGPRKTGKADFAIVAIPGFLGGAGSFDQVARNTVLAAKKDGYEIEFWALDRRANCLEDDHGIHAAERAGDPQLAYDYYWGGEEVDGETFAGWETGTSAPFVGSFGLERTVRDWHAVVKTMIPGRKRRARKLLCGGHSLGGPLTAAYSSWDFDGDPSTLDDAGYKQCAGLFGLDTTLDLAGGGPAGIPFGDVLDLLGQNPAAPFLDVTPLTPETMQVTSVFGVGSYFKPTDTGLIENLPSSPNLDAANRLLFSRDAAEAATGMPGIRNFDLTNEVVLGGVFDDNSANALSFIRASVGFIAPGLPLTDKNLPTQGDGTYALPGDPEAGLYGWDNYSRVGKRGREITANEAGAPYTSRESEVSDLKQFARTFFEGPANFIEQYFPVRLVVDVAAAESGAFEDLAHDGPARRSVLLIQAGDSDSNDGEDSGPPLKGEAPNERPLSGEVILPGYNHLDVLTAARRQNDGRPEGTSATLAEWAAKVVRKRSRHPLGPAG